MKLWHDDIRKPPDDSWVWARTNKAAKEILENNTVEEASLDHDMGMHFHNPDDPNAIYLKGMEADNGYELVKWMCETENIPKKVTIHSWNPSGALRMRDHLIASNTGCKVVYIPYGCS